jgi:hypothetical protein
MFNITDTSPDFNQPNTTSLPGVTAPVRREEHPAPDSTSGASRGLSFNKQKYSCFHSSSKKKLIVVDQYKARYHRMRKKVVAWSNQMNDGLRGKPLRHVMITLTYAGDNRDWMPNQINEFIRTVKKNLGNKLYGIAWVGETQLRGVIHYHVYLIVRKGTRIPMPDKAGWWKFGMSRIETGRSPYYLIKYLGKEYQKNFSEMPKGARSFAISVSDKVIRLAVRFACLRVWEQVAVARDGWECLYSEREWHKSQSDWQLVYITDNIELVKTLEWCYRKEGMIV